VIPVSHPFRGIVVGILISVPLWVLIFFAVTSYVDRNHEAELHQKLNNTVASDEAGRDNSQLPATTDVPAAN
jgi:hypothetical protein